MSHAKKPQESSNYPPKDLLQRLISRNHISNRFCQQETETENEESEDIELSLGLSLNGRFGVDPKAKKLTRSSSIPDLIINNNINNPTREKAAAFMVPLVSKSSSSNETNLVRTCSLPTETDEEWRKRKEIQMLRRLEAKRKRSEKQRNFKALKDKKECNFKDDKRDCHNSNNQQEVLVKNFNSLFGVGGEGSIGSQGSGSSGLSESESPPNQGMNNCSEARSPISVQSLSLSEKKPTVPPKSGVYEKLGNHAGVAAEYTGRSVSGSKEMVRNILEDMPCVFAKGAGPNGKRIEGFLCRYRKGEEVRIVCECHGSSLSPAEFVKHAGGGDVAHPLKHIVVNPYPLL